jgi:hypothetical protein
VETQNPYRNLDGGAGTPSRKEADVAFRRAWWSLALYPVSFVAAFVIGEGLFSVFDDETGDPALWVILLAATPAMMVFVLPGVLAVTQGRKAIRLGRPDGRLPAIVGAIVGAAFVGLNAVSYVLQVLVD